MDDLRVAAAQFEARDNDKPYNLARIRELTKIATGQGAQVVSFHECSITGYTFLQTLSEDGLRALAEPVPDGPSVRELHAIARDANVVVMAGLIESGDDGRLYKCYAVVSPGGFVAKYRKLHPFIHPAITPGAGYVVIDLLGWRAGFSICYDNNLPENVRMNALLGAQVVFMPHVCGCTPSPMPGRGPVPRELWGNRDRDPVPLRQAFQGPGGRGWLMKWLPARAWENGVYAVFANAVGVDHDTIKPGLAMVLDPYGEVMTESDALGDDVVVATLTEEKLRLSSGHRYIAARRPELYGKLVEPPPDGATPRAVPAWRACP
jgi:predicted amidohydrolase